MRVTSVSIRDDLYKKIIENGFRVSQIINMLLDNYFQTGTEITNDDVKLMSDMTFSEQVRYACEQCNIDVEDIKLRGIPTCDEMSLVTSFLVNRGVATTQPSVYERFMRDNGLG